MDEFNPYAAPKAEIIKQDSEAETIRRTHINHEASIKSVGCLYGLAALALGALVIVGLNTFQRQSAGETALSGVLAVLAGALAFGLRNLRRWAGILAALWAGVLLVLGIANLPASAIGMVISAYIIFLMIGAKGRMVLSPEYKTIIAQTPHVKRRTSVVVWVLLAILLGILAFTLYGAMSR